MKCPNQKAHHSEAEHRNHGVAEGDQAPGIGLSDPINLDSKEKGREAVLENFFCDQ